MRLQKGEFTLQTYTGKLGLEEQVDDKGEGVWMQIGRCGGGRAVNEAYRRRWVRLQLDIKRQITKTKINRQRSEM